MGILDRILGNESPAPRPNAPVPADGDARAVERYRYMLQTAPPETIEEAHAEAFSKLTPEQRKLALQTLAQAAPPQERAAVEATSPDDPRAMGRLATRAEMRQPGFLERSFGGGGGGMGGLGGSLLTSFAAGFVGSMVAQSFFSSMGDGGFGGGTNEADAAGDVDGTVDDPQAAADADAGDVEGDALDGDVGGGFDGDFGGGDFDV